MVTPAPIQIATLGWEDSLILMVLALVVFGPRRLPLIGRQIGKLMYEFRKASNDFKFQMEEELRNAEEADRRKKEEAERQRVAALAAQSQASVSAPAQTVEASADIGAAEPPVPPGYPESYPPETETETATPAATAELTDQAPVIQPPQTGEQVSAAARIARPDYYFESSREGSSSETTSEPAAAAAVKPDADVAANAEELAAEAPANGSEPAAESQLQAKVPDSLEKAAPAPAKETVSQHG